jgi:primosomal protein N' (replication factor Y) (superfamily II helicase)
LFDTGGVYLIKAIPIARGVGADVLSYWSPKSPETGSVIRVPLRKRTVGALVLTSEPALELKTEIRSADFELKKISSTHSKSIIFPQFFKTAEEIARYYAGTVGSALFELMPAVILAEYEKLPTAKEIITRKRPRESFALQKNDEDRFAHYKSLIRERFARKESVFMMMPTVEDIKNACSYFEKGIEPYTYILHAGLSKNEIVKVWKAAVEDTHPVIIVATGSFLSIPRPDIGIIIVERENSRSYKAHARPFLDYRNVAENYAKSIGADYIAGDSCLRVETLYREEEAELVEYAPLAMRSLSTARDTLVDMKSYKNAEHNIRLLSDELISLAKKNKTESGLMFVFAGRRGLAPQTICADCETTVSCDVCSSPLVLYGKDGARFFLCNKCGKKFEAEQTCKQCGGWRLTTLGIGSERIEEELREVLPESKIWRLDKLSAPSHKKASEIVEKWYASPGSILVGTELALLYLDRNIDNSAVASLDAFFSIPDFRINEKVFSIILKMRSITQKHFLLQTRSPEVPVLAWGVKGNIIDFYRDEIQSRKQFSFPPFSTFIKISSAGIKEDVLAEMETLKVLLAGWNVDVFPAFIATVRGDYIMHALIKLKRGEWVNNELLERLRNLPPNYAVNVDPESIL